MKCSLQVTGNTADSFSNLRSQLRYDQRHDPGHVQPGGGRAGGELAALTQPIAGQTKSRLRREST